MRAFDLGKYQRLVGFDGGRITGNFAVLLSPKGKESWVRAHDVVIWDEGHHSGRVLYSNDLTGSVKDGVADLSKHMISESKLADVEDVWEQMMEVMVACVEAARREGGEGHE